VIVEIGSVGMCPGVNGAARCREKRQGSRLSLEILWRSGRLVAMFVCVVQGCASLPDADVEPATLNEAALRSCLGGRIPIEMLHDPKVRSSSVSLDLTVLPSGRIDSVAVLSGSGNAELDAYLADRLRDSRCIPFLRMDTPDPYLVTLDLDLDTGASK
jgi:hypothetical protein